MSLVSYLFECELADLWKIRDLCEEISFEDNPLISSIKYSSEKEDCKDDRDFMKKTDKLIKLFEDETSLIQIFQHPDDSSKILFRIIENGWLLKNKLLSLAKSENYLTNRFYDGRSDYYEISEEERDYRRHLGDSIDTLIQKREWMTVDIVSAETAKEYALSLIRKRFEARVKA